MQEANIVLSPKVKDDEDLICYLGSQNSLEEVPFASIHSSSYSNFIAVKDNWRPFLILKGLRIVVQEWLMEHHHYFKLKLLTSLRFIS